MKPEQSPLNPERVSQQELMDRLLSRTENGPKIRGTADIPYFDWSDDDDD